MVYRVIVLNNFSKRNYCEYGLFRKMTGIRREAVTRWGHLSLLHKSSLQTMNRKKNTFKNVCNNIIIIKFKLR